MQIACPSCKARINVPDDKIKSTGTKVKCGKCTKIFTVKKKASQSSEAATKSPAVAPPAAPARGDDLDDLFGGPAGAEQAPATEKPAAEPDSADELGLGQSSAPVSDEDIFDGDNFGAEMDNYKTQLRPVGRSRDEDLFGSSSDLDEPAKSPARDDDAGDLFGSGDDLLDESASKDEPDAPFEDAGPKHEAPRAARSAMPGKEDLDDLFGKGLDDDPSDELVNKLLEAKPSKEPEDAKDGLDDLFAGDRAQRESPANAPSSDKLDALFQDDDDGQPAAPQRPKTPKSESETLDLAGSKPSAGPKPGGSNRPSAEELASTMELEPALKEDDLPRQSSPKPAEKKAAAAKKAKAPVKLIVLGLLFLVLIGGAGATLFVPAINKPVMSAVHKIPFEELLAKVLPSDEAAKPEPVKIGVTIRGGRLLTGGRGDKLYVLEGTVRNDYPGPRSFIKVKGVLIDAEGSIVATREVYAGNVLNDDEIRGLERVKIDGTLNRSVGGGLQNFNVPSGSSIPFQIVFYDVEQPVSNYTVSPIGAEPGS